MTQFSEQNEGEESEEPDLRAALKDILKNYLGDSEDYKAPTTFADFNSENCYSIHIAEYESGERSIAMVAGNADLFGNDRVVQRDYKSGDERFSEDFRIAKALLDACEFDSFDSTVIVSDDALLKIKGGKLVKVVDHYEKTESKYRENCR